jgi:6-phosphogluconolactonase
VVPPTPELLAEPGLEEASETCARRIAATVTDALERRGAAHVALSGGATPQRSLELLGPLVADWRGAHLWFCDERCVAPDDAASNHRMARAALHAPGAIWHRMQGELGPDAGARAYERELADVVLDLAALGIGEDGHTASLFPDHPALEAPGRVSGVRGAPKPPPERITLTLAALGAARARLLLVAGDAKAAALHAALGEPTPHVPASLLEREHLTVVATRDALGAAS